MLVFALVISVVITLRYQKHH